MHLRASRHCIQDIKGFAAPATPPLRVILTGTIGGVHVNTVIVVVVGFITAGMGKS